MRCYTKPVDPALSQKELHDAAYALLFVALKTEWGIAEPVILKTPRGKPYLSGEHMPRVSVSHTKGLVCCAVSEKNVGIDCEYRRPLRMGAAKRVCTPAELSLVLHDPDPDARFLTYWTLKESISKCRGTGLSEPFRRYEISFQGDKPHCAGYVLHTEQHGDHFLAAAEEA